MLTRLYKCAQVRTGLLVLGVVGEQVVLQVITPGPLVTFMPVSGLTRATFMPKPNTWQRCVCVCMSVRIFNFEHAKLSV